MDELLTRVSFLLFNEILQLRLKLRFENWTSELKTNDLTGYNKIK